MGRWRGRSCSADICREQFLHGPDLSASDAQGLRSENQRQKHGGNEGLLPADGYTLWCDLRLQSENRRSDLEEAFWRGPILGLLYAESMGLGHHRRADHHQKRPHIHRWIDGFPRARRRSQDRKRVVEGASGCTLRGHTGNLHLQRQAICRVQRGRQPAAHAEDQRSSGRIRAAMKASRATFVQLAAAMSAGILTALLFTTSASANDAALQPGLTGDWNGARTDLTNEGLQFQVKGIFEGAYNPSGGDNNSAAGAGELDFVALADLGKLVGDDGGSVEAKITKRFGANLVDVAGLDTLMQVQEIWGRGDIWRLT